MGPWTVAVETLEGPRRARGRNAGVGEGCSDGCEGSEVGGDIGWKEAEVGVLGREGSVEDDISVVSR